MRALRWILGWSVDLAAPAGVFVFAAGPEEAGSVARDAWGGVREAASEAWDGLSSGDGPGPEAPGRDAPEEEWGVVAGRMSFHGMACEWEEDTARIVDEGEFLSALEARVSSHVAITGRPNVMRRDFEVGLASPPPSTLPPGEGGVHRGAMARVRSRPVDAEGGHRAVPRELPVQLHQCHGAGGDHRFGDPAPGVPLTATF